VIDGRVVELTGDRCSVFSRLMRYSIHCIRRVKYGPVRCWSVVDCPVVGVDPVGRSNSVLVSGPVMVMRWSVGIRSSQVEW
jgi:hypothetical protein